MLAVKQKPALRQNLLEHRLALEQGLAVQILPVDIKEIEHAIEHTRGLTLGILQELEARAPMLIEGHELAVEYGLVLDLGEGLADRGIFPRDVVEVAGIERRVARPRHGDSAEAVPFGFKYPIRIVERLVGQGGKHRAKIELHRD